MPTSESSIAWFADIGITDRPTVGGKGGSLGELTKLGEISGAQVPPGFVVTTQAFEQFLTALEKNGPVRSRVEALAPADSQAIQSLSRELRARVAQEPMPEALETALREAHAQLCAEGTFPVAVRSSATTEDAEDASFAGLQDTFLWVLDSADMIEHIRECWGSLYSVESLTYRLRQGLPEDGVAMAVVVQQMVDARSAGVMFTRSPITGDKSVIAVEGAWGLGSAVVSGEVTPDRWVLGKITGEISVRDISDKHVQQIPAEGGGIAEIEVEASKRKTPCLTDDDLQALREIGRKIERHYGRPQDIEWAVGKDGRIYLLQSRPETVWSAKEAAPVKKPEADPLKHVMSIFGGRR